MKTKNSKTHRPFHLHLEYFLRHRYLVFGVMGLLLLAIARADHRTMNFMRDAYIHSFDAVGEHMREETSRNHLTVEVRARTASYSGV